MVAEVGLDLLGWRESDLHMLCLDMCLPLSFDVAEKATSFGRGSNCSL